VSSRRISSAPDQAAAARSRDAYSDPVRSARGRPRATAAGRQSLWHSEYTHPAVRMQPPGQVRGGVLGPLGQRDAGGALRPTQTFQLPAVVGAISR